MTAARKKELVKRKDRPDDLVKRAYYDRACIAEAFKVDCRGDVSMPDNAAKLIWLALADFPEARNKALDLVDEINVDNQI